MASSSPTAGGAPRSKRGPGPWWHEACEGMQVGGCEGMRGGGRGGGGDVTERLPGLGE